MRHGALSMPSMKKDPVGSRSNGSEVRLEVMEALGRNVEAQVFRWQCFERTLSSAHLRTYLKRLPDFDDLEAEERAIPTLLDFRASIRHWRFWCLGPLWKRPRRS